MLAAVNNKIKDKYFRFSHVHTKNQQNFTVTKTQMGKNNFKVQIELFNPFLKSSQIMLFN